MADTKSFLSRLGIILGIWIIYWIGTWLLFEDVRAAAYSMGALSTLILIPTVLVLDRKFQKNPSYTLSEFLLISVISLLPCILWLGLFTSVNS